MLLPFRTESRPKLNVTVLYIPCFEINSEICAKQQKGYVEWRNGGSFLITEIVSFAYNNPSCVHT